MERIKTKSFLLAVYAKGDEKSERVALVLPGKLDTKDYQHMRSHVDFLAERGFFALSFDPPGTWESSWDMSLYTTTNYLKAINEIIEYLENRPTFLVGHSRGGTLAMLAAISNPYVYSFVSIMSNTGKSVSSQPLIPGKPSISYRDLPGKPEEKIKIELPYSFFEDSAKFDIVKGLKNCTKPKLFILGTKDTTIPPEKVREAFNSSAEPKELYELDSDHSYRWHPNLIEEVNKVIGEFLRQ
jgi:pimeloyl-ACP methyl ester carboxylesterase